MWDERRVIARAAGAEKGIGGRGGQRGVKGRSGQRSVKGRSGQRGVKGRRMVFRAMRPSQSLTTEPRVVERAPTHPRNLDGKEQL